MVKQTTDTNFESTVLAVTAEKYIPKLTQNIFNYNAALVKINEKSSVNFTRSGDEVIVPILLGKNNNTKAYAPYEAFDLTPQKGIVDAAAKIRDYAAPIVISDNELRINSGKEQIVSIMSAKLMQADESLKQRMNLHMYDDGTADGGKALLGLKAMCEESGTPGAYMGITDATNWINQYQTGSAGQLLSKMGALYYSQKDGGDAPDLILCDDKFAILYEAANQSTSGVGIQYVDAKLADAGFTHISYRGVPMVNDKSLTASVGKAYFLNSKYLGFLFENPETTEFVRMPNQLAKSAFLKCSTQLITSRRNRQGVVVLS